MAEFECLFDIYRANDAKCFSKTDLQKDYHQIELEEESIKITRFDTHKGVYHSKRPVNGASPAFESFQRIIE